MMWERPDGNASAAQPSCNKRTDEGDRLLVSLHDVTPAHADRLARAERLLVRLGIPTATYLFVPNFHGQWRADADADFMAWCRAPRPFDVRWFLHGYFHREDRGRRATFADACRRMALTAGEGEFLSLRGRALDLRVRSGVDAFERCFGERPIGFVAPAWLYNDDLLPALTRARIAITESHFHVFHVRQNRAVPSPVIAWASRSSVHRAAARPAVAVMRRLWRRRRLVRIALHPLDFDHPAIVESICRTIDALRLSRRVVAYVDVCTADLHM